MLSLRVVSFHFLLLLISLRSSSSGGSMAVGVSRRTTVSRKTHDRALDSCDDLVLLRLGELHHAGRQDLGHAADARADDEEAAGRSFDDAGAERLGEGRVEVDLAADQVLNLTLMSAACQSRLRASSTHLSDLALRNGARQLDSLLEEVLLSHLLQLDALGSITADQEAYRRVSSADARDGSGEQIDALAVHQAREDDNRHCIQRC